MRFIRPISITPSMITDSNVAEDDYAAWNSATSYVIGNRCLYNHKIYECLINHTNAQPDTNSSGYTPKWLDIGYNNRWKAFDLKVGSQTENSTTITYSILPGVVFDSIAFLDLDAISVDVTITDPIEGVVFQESVDLIMTENVNDLYTYFFEPIITRRSIVLGGIPPYSAATISIVISNDTGETAKVGTIAIGTQKYIGITEKGVSYEIADYSIWEELFGEFYVKEGLYSKDINANAIFYTDNVDDINVTLSETRATPVVWVCTDTGISSLIAYGFCRKFKVVNRDSVFSIVNMRILSKI